MISQLDIRLQLLAGMECNHAPGGDRNFLTCFRIATRALRFIAQLEISEAGKFDSVSGLQGIANFFKKSFHHIFGFSLVEAYLFKQQVSELGFSQRYHLFCQARS